MVGDGEIWVERRWLIRREGGCPCPAKLVVDWIVVLGLRLRSGGSLFNFEGSWSLGIYRQFDAAMHLRAPQPFLAF